MSLSHRFGDGMDPSIAWVGWDDCVFN